MDRADWKRFLADETGSVGILSLFWFMLLLGIAGITIDAADGYRHKAILQATADAAALAAAIDLPDADAARATALDYVRANMPPERHGVVLADQDVVTGLWDWETRTLDTSASTADSITVIARRSTRNDNPLLLSVLRVFGFDHWDVAASATAMRFYPGCLSREGLISAKRVHMDTQNFFQNNFCVHGAEGVTVKNDNTYEEGVKVTMEDLADFEMPTDGFASNPGLEPALGVDSYDLFILEILDELVVELRDPASEYQPSYIDPDLPALTAERSASDIQANGLAPNRVHYLPCNYRKNILLLPGNMTYSDVVIITDCSIQIEGGAHFYNVTMATSFLDPDEPAVTSSAKVRWGMDDGCAPGNGARLLALGEALVSAQNQYFGAQFISLGQVHVHAQAGAGTGVSVISGEDIVLTSQGTMGLCPNPFIDSESYRLPYYRLVA